MSNAIARNFDAAMQTAKIDADSIEWIGFRRISVCINGRTYEANLKSRTEAGLKAALVDCLSEHCAIVAAATTALERCA